MTNYNLDQFTDFEIEGININDYPDFCDAFVLSASFKGQSGWREASDDELDWLNEQSDFIYQLVLEHIF